MKNKLLYLLTSVVFFTCCDCVQKATGVVLDKESKAPIENATLSNKNTDQDQPFTRRVYTNSTGHFEYNGISGGLFGCPDLTLYITKEGFKKTKMTYKSYSKNDTIYIERIK